MKILRIIKNPAETEWAEKAALHRLHVDVVDISPTLLSAFTAMTIAKASDAHKSKVVIVERVTDAIAAISAKRIAQAADLKVVFSVRPNEEPPHHMPKDVVNGVDLWLFTSERQLNIYPIVTNNRYVVPPVSAIDEEALTELSQKTSNDTPILSWIGNITDGERLKKVMDKVDALGGRVQLRICGAGKARDVMPAVKYSRTLRHTESITWVGEEYNKLKEIKLCDAAVHSAPDITITETEIALSGRPVLTLDEIDSWASKTLTAKDEPAKVNNEKSNTNKETNESEKHDSTIHQVAENIDAQNKYDRALRTALSSIIFID